MIDLNDIDLVKLNRDQKQTIQTPYGGDLVKGNGTPAISAKPRLVKYMFKFGEKPSVP